MNMPVNAYAASPAYNLTVSVQANATAGNPSAVTVYLNNGGTPVGNAAVSLSVSGGSISPASVTTDSSGYAAAIFSAPTTAGTVTLTASNANSPTINQTIQVTGGQPISMLISSANSTLMRANTGKAFIYKVALNDTYGNPCGGASVNLTVDGSQNTVIAAPDGTVTSSLGPTSFNHTYNVTVNSASITQNFAVQFMLPRIIFLNTTNSVPAGSNASLTVWLLDDITPVKNFQLNFDVYTPGNVQPTKYTGYTDSNGTATLNFATGTKVGSNTIIVYNSTLGDIDSTTIMGTGGNVGKIVLGSDPVSPIVADGTTQYRLQMWAQDSGGNPIKNETLNVTRNNGINYLVTTNSNGYAYLDIMPSTYVGIANFYVVSTSSPNINNSIVLSYVAGAPAKTAVKANPNVIASSEISTPLGKPDVHTTQIIGLVTDQWDHPIAAQPIQISSMNITAGNITGPTNGVTDSNGEFYTNFTLGNYSYGTGTVNLKAQSGSYTSTYPVKYTNTTFVGMETTITPRNISVNDTINVDVTLRGIGWDNRPQPVDVMLITDKSGSMAWYSTMVYPTNSSDSTGLHGTLPKPNDTEYLIGTYTNTQYSTLQFFLSCPYTNYDNGSYYYGLKVTDPSGTNHTGSNSNNENQYLFSTAPISSSKPYKIYGKFHYSAAGGVPQYNLAVLTSPLRLGSNLDTNTAAKIAAIQFVNNMSSQDQIGLSSFDSSGYLNTHLKLDYGTNKTNLINAINGLDASGSTNIYTGMQKARQEFGTNGRSQYKHVGIILTDGYSQSPANDISEAYNAKNAGITLFTIGMGMADEPTLKKIANITGGDYYNVKSVSDLVDTYAGIKNNITSPMIANRSTMQIVSNRTVVNGTIISDAEYISGSAMVMFTNGSRYQIEPMISYDNSHYVLTWNPGQINVNDVWKVDYQMKVMHGGMLTPITNESSVSIIRPDGTNETTFFAGDKIYCNDKPSGTISGGSETLSVQIVSPNDGDSINQMQVPISWNVVYKGKDQYTQKVSIMPEGGSTWSDLATGFVGDSKSVGFYTYNWNLERLPAGKYSVRVYANDGTYDDSCTVTVTIPPAGGKIILQ